MVALQWNRSSETRPAKRKKKIKFNYLQLAEFATF